MCATVGLHRSTPTGNEFDNFCAPRASTPVCFIMAFIQISFVAESLLVFCVHIVLYYFNSIAFEFQLDLSIDSGVSNAK